MEKEKIKKCIENDVSAGAAFVHGTGDEAVMAFGETGKFPSGIYHREEERKHKDHGYLHFIPVTLNVYGLPPGMPYISRTDAITDAKMYAKVTAFTQDMATKLKCKTAEQYYTIYEHALGQLAAEETSKSDAMKSLKMLQEDLKRLKLDVNMPMLEQSQTEARKLKGVIIEADKSIMQLPYTVDFNRESLAFYCPDGLDAKYIKGIDILGFFDKKKIDSYLNGNLKYRGFATEA